MFPGPFAIAVASLEDPDSDAITLRTVRFGFDSAEEAHSAIPQIAKDEEKDIDELCVYQIIEKES
tara:strand:- start:977 stop:1171 length:195 start_codon:yes stop_codon:yes gene_type:complete